MTFKELYDRLVAEKVSGRESDGKSGCDPRQLDCLLHPEKYAAVIRTDDCQCGSSQPHCAAVCLFEAIGRDADGNIVIDSEKCAGCSACIDACRSGVLTASRDVLPTLDAVKNAKGSVYALIAPAFLGQFSEDVTPGKLRSAFKMLGFDGMIEVSLFADILTLREALEFDRNIRSETDFQLTSCCCPMWIAMIRKLYAKLMPHIPGAVSPMIAAGRTVKILHPDALTVFVGPCIAKKPEAREADVRGAVDHVLTFREVQDVFNAAGIVPAVCEESEKDHSSRAGRIYARAGGVSEAVSATLERLDPDKNIKIKTKNADGVPACKAMIEDLLNGNADGNF